MIYVDNIPAETTSDAIENADRKAHVDGVNPTALIQLNEIKAERTEISGGQEAQFNGVDPSALIQNNAIKAEITENNGGQETIFPPVETRAVQIEPAVKLENTDSIDSVGSLQIDEIKTDGNDADVEGVYNKYLNIYQLFHSKTNNLY